MSSVSVSFRSARAAVNDNITAKVDVHAASHLPPPRNSTALGTWSAGKEPDALSKLVTDGVFHVQNCCMLVGGCSSSLYAERRTSKNSTSAKAFDRHLLGLH